MSWFSDLAGKAETLLNKIDQNAAAVLQEKEKKHHLNTTIYNHKSVDENHDKLAPLSIPKSQSESNLETKSSSPFKAKSLKRSNRGFHKKSDVISVSSSTSFEKPNFFLSDTDAVDAKLSNGNGKEDSVSDSKILIEHESKLFPIDVVTVDDVDVSDNWTNDRKITMENGLEDHDETLNGSSSFVDMENQLLRNEISVVNNEVSLLLSKAKNAEKITEDTQVRLLQVERIHSEALKDKSLLEQKVFAYEKRLKEFQSEPNDEKSEIDENLKTLESEKRCLQEKVKELELSLISNESVKNELANNLQASDKARLELEKKLEKAKSEMASVLTEWKNYKVRANNTLLMKEKIIEELGENSKNVSTDGENTVTTQINQLKQERLELMEESSKYQSQCETKAKEIEQLETRLRTSEHQIYVLREAIRQEKAAKEMSEHTVNSLGKEMKALQLETTKQISSLRTKVRENQPQENDRLLRNVNKSSLNIAESGEERFRSLTQALVAKQAALESVTSDRNALRLQLEKTENKYRSDLVNMKNNQPRIINVNDTDDVKSRFPLMQESPWDSNISRGVKKAYSTLDSFSVRVGVFLRRNPIARIFIISYMIILHLWVFVVLFTYTPEVHQTK